MRKLAFVIRMLTCAIFLSVLALSVLSCANSVTTGTKNIEAVNIQRGVTTEQQLIATLGSPQGRGLDSKGRKMLTWNRMDVGNTGKVWIPVVGPFLPGAEAVHKRQLSVSFDSSDRVADFRVITEEHEANIMGETNQ